MIEVPEKISKIWDRYRLPERKRVHVTLVAEVAVFFAEELTKRGIAVDTARLRDAALLHDVDKAAQTLPGEEHPDAAVRILRQEGMEDILHIVAAHPLHTITDPKLIPITWEEKLLYLADKMVKYDIGTVDTRFALWEAENLDSRAKTILRESYPKVKALEEEVCSLIGIRPGEVAELVKTRYT